MDQNQSQNIQIIHHDDIVALKNKGLKEENSLSWSQKFHTSYPYLATFLSFWVLFITMSLGILLFINLPDLFLFQVGTSQNALFVVRSVIVCLAHLIGGFYVFKVVVQKHLLPYVKP